MERDGVSEIYLYCWGGQKLFFSGVKRESFPRLKPLRLREICHPAGEKGDFSPNPVIAQHLVPQQRSAFATGSAV